MVLFALTYEENQNLNPLFPIIVTIKLKKINKSFPSIIDLNNFNILLGYSLYLLIYLA